MNHLLMFILLLLQIVLFHSCHIQQNVAGIYTAPIRGRYPNSIPVTNYIELKNDGTFYYQFKGGFIEKISYGKWESLIPFPLQDRIQSETYKVKDEKNNLYHISFTHSIDYSIFYYTPFLDSLVIKRNRIFVDGVKMEKMIRR